VDLLNFCRCSQKRKYGGIRSWDKLPELAAARLTEVEEVSAGFRAKNIFEAVICVAQVGLELSIFLPQPLKGWNYRCVIPHPATKNIFVI
jgi:hypothetical protein